MTVLEQKLSVFQEVIKDNIKSFIATQDSLVFSCQTQKIREMFSVCEELERLSALVGKEGQSILQRLCSQFEQGPGSRQASHGSVFDLVVRVSVIQIAKV